ncbi:MAG: fused DSP-PTPase phosphatase/NAD kinase-like protein [Acidimicrobiia bacterium]
MPERGRRRPGPSALNTEAPSSSAPARSWLRRARLVAIVYVAVTAIFHIGLIAAMLIARSLGHDPRSDEAGSVHNLRRVDERVWAGAQPDEAGYRELAGRGVRLVIDLRTGSSDDPHVDDVGFLAALGMGRVALPVPDGHVPSRATVEHLVRAIEGAEGPVYLHCGGGVGRSAASQAAYLAATGRDPSWAEMVALGPMTLEQNWFVGAAGPGAPHRTNPVVRRVSEALDAPRRALSRVRAWVR